MLFSWIRRSRFDTDGWEAGDVPLGEETEAYRLEILNGASVVRGVNVSTPQYLYTATQIAADFGVAPASLSLRLQQLSTAFGPGAVLQRTLNV